MLSSLLVCHYNTSAFIFGMLILSLIVVEHSVGLCLKCMLFCTCKLFSWQFCSRIPYWWPLTSSVVHFDEKIWQESTSKEPHRVERIVSKHIHSVLYWVCFKLVCTNDSRCYTAWLWWCTSPWNRSVHSGKKGSCWCPGGEWAEPLPGCEELEAEPDSLSAAPSWLRGDRDEGETQVSQGTYSSTDSLKEWYSMFFSIERLTRHVIFSPYFKCHRGPNFSLFGLFINWCHSDPAPSAELNHFWSWCCRYRWAEAHWKSWLECSQTLSSWIICKYSMWWHWWGKWTCVSPPAACSKAPSSAGITKCVTLTTSLLVSSWKRLHCSFNCEKTRSSDRFSLQRMRSIIPTVETESRGKRMKPTTFIAKFPVRLLCNVSPNFHLTVSLLFLSSSALLLASNFICEQIIRCKHR